MTIAGFATRLFEVNGTIIHAAIAGTGPPLLLLHGYPQTHLMWAKIAPQLAERFTVVAADLRGYGDSGKPVDTGDHAAYSKRVMATDMIAVMAALGHTRFAVAGHDRGARVAYRMALDHPDAIERLALLDIVPSLVVYETVDRAVATAYFHWFLLIQPSPLPEALIGTNADLWLDTVFGAWSGTPSAFAPEVIAEYRRCFDVAATCADYRAGATIDCVHDAADRAAGRRITCPTLILWGEHGLVGRREPLRIWADWASDVRGQGLPCGHFLPEEAPAETLTALAGFLD